MSEIPFVPPSVSSAPLYKCKNEIDAIYAQMRNSGALYIGYLGRPPMSIWDWRENELERLRGEELT